MKPEGYVSIANLALQHIGEDDRISDPDETSRAARAVATAWEGTRKFVLNEAHWGFALRTVDLAARPADPAYPIALERTAFPLPADLVTLVEIVEPDLDDESEEYSIEAGPDGGEELLTGESGPITIRYVRDSASIQDPARWPPAFIEAFAWRLAWQISEALAADKGRKDRAFAQSERSLKKARRANAREKPPRDKAVTPWSRARVIGIDRAPGT